MSQEAMKLALEALKDATLHIWLGDKKGSEANIRAHKAIDVLEEALAKQEQGEPVAESVEKLKELGWNDAAIDKANTPQQRTWVGLDLDERSTCYEKSGGNLAKFAKELEAKLKEKNT